jgi:hypothetical protein
LEKSFPSCRSSGKKLSLKEGKAILFRIEAFKVFNHALLWTVFRKRSEGEFHVWTGSERGSVTRSAGGGQVQLLRF